MNTPTTASDPYRALEATLRENGLFEHRPLFYSIYTLILLVGFIASMYILTLGPIFWLQTLNALLLAVVSMQFGFLGHDIAHGQVFRSKGLARWIGSTVYAAFLGLSLDHWYGGHREHHTHTNHVDKDPDIQLPFVFTDVQLKHSSEWFRALVLPYQHWYFFLIMPLAYLNYTVKSLPWDLGVLIRPIRWFELLLIALHFMLFLYLVFVTQGFVLGSYFLVLTAIASGAYAGFSFAPNHKGEEVLDTDASVTWRTQIITTRNIFGSPFTDLALGGLNYQIEHHLFSYMPRPNLGKAQPFVKAFCKEHDLPYHETTFVGSMREMYVALRHYAKQERANTPRVV